MLHKLPSGYREKPLEETLMLLEGRLEQMGVTRVSDITGLDYLGLPVYQAFRPESTYSVSVFSGKGMSGLEAKVSALMEALESYVAERYRSEVIEGSYQALYSQGYKVISPKVLCLSPKITEKTLLHWTKVQSRNGSEAWVPRELIWMPCPQRMWPVNTNGIASGNSFEEAYLHGLLEVVERDALSIALASQVSAQVHPSLLKQAEVKALLEKIEGAGLKITLHDITGDLLIPSFYVLLWDPSEKSIWFTHSGSASHLDPAIALKKAILEAVQSRVCMIAGAREDLRSDQARLNMDPDLIEQGLVAIWKQPSSNPPLEATFLDFESIDKCLEFLEKKLKEKGMDVFFAELSIPNLPFHVIRVLVPYLECFAIDKQRIGKRLLAKQPLLRDLIN